MTKGPRRLVLDQYLDSAAPDVLKGAGRDWKNKADDLQDLGDALKQAAQQAELRIGEQTLTGPALRAGMEESSASMITKSEQLRAAGEALTQVGQQLADTRELRDNFKDLGEKPSAYQPPPGTPGVEPTDEEIAAQAGASQARQDERTAWQNAYDKQEARSLALTKDMDAAFMAAIPPMKDIHGQEDPTEPPPNVPSGPGGTYLPGTQAPPPTGGVNGGGGEDNKRGEVIGTNPPNHPANNNPPIHHPPTNQPPTNQPPTNQPPTNQPPIHTATLTPTATPITAPTHLPTHIGTEAPTSTVTGSSQNGVTYQPTGSQVSAPTSASGGSSGASAAALGAAGGAGAMAAGAVRPGAAASAGSSAPVRAIGSTGRAGSAGALSRSGGSAGNSSAGRAGSAGNPASRSAGSPSGRGASTGTSAGRGASTGTSAGRGASTGSSAGRGGAGARGAASASGSGSGSGSGGRGSSGARSAGAGAGAGAGGSRGGRKGEREQTTDRDSLVYDQDWLGDDDIAPGVLD